MVTLTCPVCKGEGVIPDPSLEGFLDTECPACDGYGWLEADLEDEDDPS
jgi:DnaJ-class molecular chaperone